MSGAASLTEALAYYEQGRVSEAEATCRNLLEHQPQHADGWHLLGIIAIGTSRPETGIGTSANPSL